MERISHAHLSYGDRQWTFTTAEAQDSGTLFEELSACSEKLGLQFAVKERSPIYPDPYVSEAFRSLYKRDFEQMEQILKPFSQANFEELLDYIPSLDFYLQMENFYRQAEKRGLVRCIPVISDEKQFCIQEMYDFTLLSSDAPNIVPNPTFFTSEDPFFFLVGANGGGKTTYLRAIGCNLVLLMAGCPIMARSGVGYPFTSVQTHYPSDERFSGMGRLDDDESLNGYYIVAIGSINNGRVGHCQLTITRAFEYLDSGNGTCLNTHVSCVQAKAGANGAHRQAEIARIV